MINEIGEIKEFKSQIEVIYELEHELEDEEHQLLERRMRHLGYLVNTFMGSKKKFVIEQIIKGRLPKVEDKDVMLEIFKTIVKKIYEINNELEKIGVE